MELLIQPQPLADPRVQPGEAQALRAARRSLRDQIARLERELGEALVAARPRVPVPEPPVRLAGPRLLDLGELELVRDRLAARLQEVREHAAAAAERQEAARLLIERMLLAPADYKWVRVTHEHIGEPSCRSWHVRPRLGLLGMLMGWWRVKISSGCPLAAARPG